MPNISKSSSSEVYKSNVSVKPSNNILTRESRKVNKINREKKRKTLILGDSFVKDIKGSRLN